jgi:hypothetical protein
VPKQKCGTCRYFQEAGLAGSGWCHHPQRKTSTDLKIFVRRNELACRDSWSRNLWESAAEGYLDADILASQLEPVAGPLPPATPEHMQALVAASANSSDASGGEDVLLSEGRIVSDFVESWQPPSRPTVSTGFDPRTAIFRAREAHRERARVKAAADRLSTGAEAVPAAALTLPPRAARLTLEPMDAGLDARDAEPIRSESGERRDDSEPDFGSGDAWPSFEPDAIDDVRFGFANGAEEAIESGGDSMTLSASQFPGETDYDHPPPLETEICVPEPIEPAIERQPAEERSRVPNTSNIDRNELPAWFQVDLPRICRVCRDFRPSADGARGSCGNMWAFTHRRLVQADDATPCQSAIGDWWAPVDEVWLVAADVSAHGRPTPLLDRLVGHPVTKRRQS